MFSAVQGIVSAATQVVAPVAAQAVSAAAQVLPAVQGAVSTATQVVAPVAAQAVSAAAQVLPAVQAVPAAPIVVVVGLVGWGLIMFIPSLVSGSGGKMMKAPGRDYRMPRKDFEKSPSNYFRDLHKK